MTLCSVNNHKTKHFDFLKFDLKPILAQKYNFGRFHRFGHKMLIRIVPSPIQLATCMGQLKLLKFVKKCRSYVQKFLVMH